MNLLIENNSDKNLRFVSGSMGYGCNAVNGYMVDDGYLYVDVAAGKKANNTISFSIEELTIYGITDIADIQVGFEISDGDYNSIYSGPRQIKTSAADSYDYTTDTYIKSINSGIVEAVYDCSIDYFAEDELYNQDGIRIVSEALMTNSEGEKVLFFEIENNSSEQVFGAAADISVNGLTICDGTWTRDYINQGTRRVMALSLSSMMDEEYWEVFGITNIGQVTCLFSIEDTDHNKLMTPQEINIAIPGTDASLDSSGTELYNDNGIRLILKGMVEDSSKYSDDIHMLLLVENNNSKVSGIDDVRDSLSINGFMTDCIVYSATIFAGRCAVVDVEMEDSSLEKNGITGIDDITEVEITFEITDEDYKTIAEPKLSIQY